MAEGLFRKLTTGQEMEVSSAGVSAYAGSAASPETMEILQTQGADLPSFQSRMVDEEMLKEADAVFCMTVQHLAMLIQLQPEFEEKYHLVCDFVEIDGQVGIDVPDPIGQGPAAYRFVSQILLQAMEGIQGYLKGRASK